MGVRFLVVVLGVGCLVYATPSSALTRRVVQLNSTATGFDVGVTPPTPLAVPSTDPSGVEFNEDTGTIFIVDSEIEELISSDDGPPRPVPDPRPPCLSYPNDSWNDVGQVNLFEASDDVSTLVSDVNLEHTTSPRNIEPTGIAYDPFDQHYYVTNDDTARLFRYDSSFNLDAEVQVAAPPGLAYPDPEGVAVKPGAAVGESRIYVLHGTGFQGFVDTYRFTSAAGLEWLAQVALPEPPVGPDDPGGIAYDVTTGDWFITSSNDMNVWQITAAGFVRAKYSIAGLTPTPIDPHGIGIDRTTPQPEVGLDVRFFLADRRVDNNNDGCERDGMIYEARIEVRPQCADGVDNDGDSFIDYPVDPQCVNAMDDKETTGTCGLGFELAPLLVLLGLRGRRARVPLIPPSART